MRKRGCAKTIFHGTVSKEEEGAREVGRRVYLIGSVKMHSEREDV